MPYGRPAPIPLAEKDLRPAAVSSRTSPPSVRHEIVQPSLPEKRPAVNSARPRIGLPSASPPCDHNTCPWEQKITDLRVLYQCIFRRLQPYPETAGIASIRDRKMGLHPNHDRLCRRYA